MSKIIALDPYDCGCTECITGLYVPLVNATIKQLKKAIKGKISNNTGFSINQLKLLKAHMEVDGYVDMSRYDHPNWWL